MVDNGPTHSELAVFEENYALLRNIITDIINPLMKCCVEKNLFTGEEQREIAAITEASDKLLLLLFKISNSLKADDTRGFYVMLKVMKEHGGKGTQSLADHIINKLKISCDQLLHICNDDVLVQNDEPKGGNLYVLCIATYLYIGTSPTLARIFVGSSFYEYKR